MTHPSFRLDYRGCRDFIARRLEAPAPAPIQLLTGPRQVGKTTLVLELADRLGPRALYAAADGPEASLPGFWERLWARAAQVAEAQGRAVVFLDEAHALGDWAGRLKGEWDRLKRKRLPVHVVATGSSALRLGASSRESLAGRFERVVLAHWPAASLVSVFRVSPAEAAGEVVRRGSYPGAFAFKEDHARWAAYVREAIVEPAIGRDVLSLASIRHPALLKQVFGACVSSPAQILSLQKIQGSLQDRGALETIAHYLSLLEDAFLVAPIEKFAAQPVRRRGAPPKIVVLNNALIAATDPRGTPDRSTDPARFGAWLENACLAFAWNLGQSVRYWREGPLEVDAVVEGSWGRWAIEVKTGPIAVRDLGGLAEFTRRFPRYRPLVVCEPSEVAAVERVGLEALAWTRFLLSGPPGATERG